MTRVPSPPESDRPVPPGHEADPCQADQITRRPVGVGVGGKFGRPALCVGIAPANFAPMTLGFFQQGKAL